MYNNNLGFNPYYQPLMPTNGQQMATQNATQLATQNRNVLNGKLVDNIEVVKATEANLDGSVSYYPLTDNSAIITKQLQTDGTSKIVVYKPVKEEENDFKFVTMETLKKSIKEIDLSEIDDIKDEIKELKSEIKKLKKNE